MNNIYTDLDSLLDTRHPIIYSLSEDIAVNILSNGYYNNRIKDNFENISRDIFISLYRNRNKSILNMSTLTKVIEFIKYNFMSDLNIVDNEDRDYILYINTYPYILTDAEKEAFRYYFSDILEHKVNVEMINDSYESLDLEWIKNNVTTIIRYDAMEWIEYNVSKSNLFVNPLLKTVIYGPKLFTGNIKSSEIEDKHFKDMVVTLSSFINYQPIDVDIFNTILSIEKNNKS